MIFFKKKKLVLNCVTNRHDVATHSPIAKAHAFYPEWWKDLPKSIAVPDSTLSAPTMKSCAGMRDLYQYGLMMPMWCDLNIDVGAIGEPKFRHQFADRQSTLLSHPPEQRGTFAEDSRYQHVKLDAPWRFQCDEEVPFIWSEPVWNMEDLIQYRVLPGIIEHKYQHAVNINLLIVRKPVEIASALIPFGAPLVHIVPLTERELVVNVIEDPRLFEKLYKPAVSFSNSYKKSRSAIESQCPFSK